MTARSQREFLQAQLAETKRLMDSVADHRWMAAGYASRILALEDEISTIPEGIPEPKAMLLFSGDPVHGSAGIDASFAGSVMAPFQAMVDADYASNTPDADQKDAPSIQTENSRLMLSALPRGSFGMELVAVDDGQQKLFSETGLAETLSRVTHLIDAAAQGPEAFGKKIGETHPSVLKGLRSFLKAIKRGHAGVKVESGDARCVMNPDKVAEAYDRVAAVVKDKADVRIRGVFRGAIMNSRRFDFSPASGAKFSGNLSKKIGDTRVGSLNRDFSDKECLGVFQKTTSTSPEGKERVSYELQDILPLTTPDQKENLEGSPVDIDEDWV